MWHVSSTVLLPIFLFVPASVYVFVLSGRHCKFASHLSLSRCRLWHDRSNHGRSCQPKSRSGGNPSVTGIGNQTNNACVHFPVVGCFALQSATASAYNGNYALALL